MQSENQEQNNGWAEGKRSVLTKTTTIALYL